MLDCGVQQSEKSVACTADLDQLVERGFALLDVYERRGLAYGGDCQKSDAPHPMTDSPTDPFLHERPE